MAVKKRKKRKASATRRRKTKRLPNWGRIGIGLAGGLVLAALVQFVISRTTSPDSGLRHALDSAHKSASKPPTQTRPASPPVATGKPKYDFYTILPEIESVVPEPGTSAHGELGKPDRDVRYVLQAGSFANFEDADRLKASLALNGLQAGIQKVAIEGRGEFHRVRLGPYSRLENLDAADRRGGIALRDPRLQRRPSRFTRPHVDERGIGRAILREELHRHALGGG